jgi:NAD(P)-dependent dehydrogenase (short-subunit alcohol dehydrogenase family)
MSTTRWTAADLPAQSGRVVIVTGANSGIGLPTARALAEAGAHVVLAVRDTAKGEAALESIPGVCEVRRLDLADLASVREFADAWQGDIDVLVNNAGVMATPARRTADGFELQIGTNHLGHFALTNLLLPHVTDRVVTVSSGAHRGGSISLDDLNWRHRPYRRWSAYQQSKLANLLFTLELERRLSVAGSSIRALAAHPGYAATNLQFRSESRVGDRLMAIGNRLFAQTDEAGARPILFAASQDLPGASYVGPDGLGERRGYPTLVGRTAAASDVEMAKRLWVLSEELTGVEFPRSLR